MARWRTILTVLISGALFGWGVPLPKLFAAFQPIIVSISIMIAAIFVRLNRGMPSLEWKGLDLQKRTELTTRIVDLSVEYGWIVTTNAVMLVGLVGLTVVGNKDGVALWPAWVQRIASGAIGAGVALCFARMAYVIWRDLDIVKLQKQLIDASAARDAREIEVKAASDKIADIRSAGLRKIGSPESKGWNG